MNVQGWGEIKSSIKVHIRQLLIVCLFVWDQDKKTQHESLGDYCLSSRRKLQSILLLCWHDQEFQADIVFISLMFM